MTGSAAKVAIVTGGARGIGRGCAIELAARGYDIALVDLLQPEMTRTAGEIAAIGRRALTYQADAAVMESATPITLPGAWVVARERRYGGTLVTVAHRNGGGS